MKRILGKKYLTAKEAADRYGYSKEWFKLRRIENKMPSFFRIEGKGRIYYPLEETDQWFDDQLKFNY